MINLTHVSTSHNQRNIRQRSSTLSSSHWVDHLFPSTRLRFNSTQMDPSPVNICSKLYTSNPSSLFYIFDPNHIRDEPGSIWITLRLLVSQSVSNTLLDRPYRPKDLEPLLYESAYPWTWPITLYMSHIAWVMLPKQFQCPLQSVPHTLQFPLCILKYHLEIGISRTTSLGSLYSSQFSPIEENTLKWAYQ